MTMPSPEQPSDTTAATSFFANRGVMALAIVAVVALIAVGVLGFLLVNSLNDDDEGTGDPTPTPFPATTGASSCGESLVMGISDTETVSMTVDAPTTLRFQNESWRVQTQVITADGIWSTSNIDAETAVWVCGTIINYVIGLPDSDANRAAMEAMALGDEIVLSTRNNVQFAFSFEGRQTVPSGNRDVYKQNVPGITLVLLGSEGGERLVVNGRYLESEASNENADNVVELGETTQLDNLQLTVSGAAYVLDRPEAPAGFAFYLIDYQLQNLGLTALDTNRLQVTLMDDLGNRYALNPVASQLGNNRPLSGFLNANQVVAATAGYQIPLGLSSSTLSWVLSRTDQGGQVQVNIPFSGGSGAARATNISLNQVQVSADLTSLILTGQINNLGDQPSVIMESDVSLKTDDGSLYLKLATNPPFPWTLSPGQTVQYSVTFQRPSTRDTAVFTILNQPFQLSNLR